MPSEFFHMYILDEPICHLTLLHSEWPKLHRVLAILSAIGLRGVWPICFITFYVLWRNICLSYANNVDPGQKPQFVASELGLHCFPISLFYWKLVINGLRGNNSCQFHSFPIGIHSEKKEFAQWEKILF